MISITALFYALITPQPWVMIPLNALLHAIAAAALWSILRAIFPRNSWATLGALPLIFFPSSLNWTTQILKDGFAIAGSLLILLAWVLVAGLEKSGQPRRKAAKILLWGYLGAFLTWLTRGYLFPPLAAVLGLLFAILLIRSVQSFRAKTTTGKELLFSVLVIMALYLPVIYGTSSPGKSQGTIARFDQISIEQSPVWGSYNKVTNNWVSTDWLPSQIENVLKAMSRSRLGFAKRVDARSLIDSEVQFYSVEDFVRYVPRALQIMFLAPFPNSWLGEGSSGSTTIMRRISALEMTFAYGSFIVLALSVHRHFRKVEFWLVVLFCGSIMLSQALVVNNIGTLYRLRFAYFMPFVGLGLASLPGLLAAHSKPNINDVN